MKKKDSHWLKMMMLEHKVENLEKAISEHAALDQSVLLGSFSKKDKISPEAGPLDRPFACEEPEEEDPNTCPRSLLAFIFCVLISKTSLNPIDALANLPCNIMTTLLLCSSIGFLPCAAALLPG
jgi:hypothetical protein